MKKSNLLINPHDINEVEEAVRQAEELSKWEEIQISEVEELIKQHPESAKVFMQKYLKHQITWDTFEPWERSLLLHSFVDMKLNSSEESQAVEALKKEDYIRVPPTPEEFLNTPTYIGPIHKKIYQPWKEDLLYVLNSKNEIHEMVLSGAIRAGKTFASILAQLYKLTVLSCLKNAPAYYGLTDKTNLYFGLFTLSLDKAEGALADTFRQMIGESPYFRNISPLRKKIGLRRVLNTIGDKSQQYEVLLPQGIHLVLGSKLQHALSIAMISGIFDEVSFRNKRTIKLEEDENSAEAVYKQLRARIQGQFNRLGQVPGVLCVISSKKATTDFLEAHIEAVKNDPHTHICGGKNGYSQWQMRPDSFSKETFSVFVGSSKTASRVLTREEKNLYPPDSPNIIEVPVDLKRDFEYDINSALREHAGIATSASALLFEDPLLITQAWSKDRVAPVADQIKLGLKDSFQIKDFFNNKELFRDAGFATVPKYHPSMLRTLHIDLSKSNDVTGICMGGTQELKEFVGKNQFGQQIIRSLVPTFWIDFCFGIKAPQGDQIDYIKIQQFINWLRSNKFKIHLITFDQFQSVGPMQMLIKDGYTVDNKSVDMTDLPYIMLRDTIAGKNLSMYRNAILEKEMINLIHSSMGARMKVDHPKMFMDGSSGSKDMSDSLAGVVSNCYDLLTDFKKHPDTANMDTASQIIGGLYTNTRPDTGDQVHINKPEEVEQELFEQHIEKINPYNFKL